MVFVYNPSDNTKKLHKIPINDENVTVLNSQNTPLDAEVYCFNLFNGNQCFLYFADSQMKPFESNYYMLTYDKSHKTTTKIELTECEAAKTAKNCTLKTEGFGQQFDTSFYSNYQNNILFRDINDNTVKHKVTVEYKFYQSMINNGQNSGAYIFRPDQSTYLNPFYYSYFPKY